MVILLVVLSLLLLLIAGILITQKTFGETVILILTLGLAVVLAPLLILISLSRISPG